MEIARSRKQSQAFTHDSQQVEEPPVKRTAFNTRDDIKQLVSVSEVFKLKGRKPMNIETLVHLNWGKR
ncbi:hypothetical protein FGO68_gene8639 [Halteria grandinella]|uniref:Uncharacterized protein n=1 Tax=Halteria grandinella TaxID=5974 RepID=A0A8J8T3R2_HALGN|nr:hypothetical protein FGO68_gene8639 [Halteria grandinella]